MIHDSLDDLGPEFSTFADGRDTDDERQIRRQNQRILLLLEELEIAYRHIDRGAARDHKDPNCCVCQQLMFQPDRICVVHRARAFIAEREQRRRGVR